MNLPIKDLRGNAAGELAVGFELIENGRGSQAVHDTVVAHRANQRSGTACTKTMGDVAGTGKKPWRQKGTGRARAGSFASPLWRGGGVTFGPKPRDFSQRIPRTTKRLALRKALSARVLSGDVVLVNEFTLPAAKTKDLTAILRSLELDGTVLIVVGAADRNLMLAARNLRPVAVTTSEELNTYEVLRADKLVFSKAAFERMGQRLTESKSQS